jgi:hypothetical protein
MKLRIVATLTFGLAGICVYPISADVRTDQKSRVEFAGVLGKVVNIFGGKAAREGVTSTVAVKGNRLARLTESTGQIVDLSEQKIYELDIKKKTYRVTTFAELRRQMEEAQRKAEEQARSAQSKEEKQTAPPAQNEKQVEIDFDLKESGQKKMINGFDTHEVVMTIAVREKGKKLEESGGLVLTSNMWMAPKIAAMNEIVDFEVRFMRELQAPTMAGASAQDMAAAMAMYPMMKDAIGRMNAENVKTDGTSILTTVKMDAVKSAEEIAQEQKAADQDSKERAPTSIGGLLGGFAKKAAAKKKDDQGEANNRVTVMTTTNEVLKVATTVGNEVAIPAGFQEK